MAQVPQEWTVLSMLEWATNYFQEHKVPSPRMSIEWLLADVLEIKRLELYMKFDRPLAPAELDELRPLVKRRAQHEPLQYITGHTDFMNVTLKVTPEVLIPRMETEQMVELILDQHDDNTQRTVVDLGTGSGCIPISLKKERPQWEVYGLDISTDALAIAQHNAQWNETKVHWIDHDIRNLASANLPPDIDILISNPPYVLEDERPDLEAQVANYEPELALFCDSPTEFYEPIISFAEKRVPNGGFLYLEIHNNHGEKIQQLLTDHGWKSKLQKDYDSNPRFLLAERIL
ncbi:MAG: peptide chain release factor N(5)-glutamine methyltransferase [Bacteroidota bacterium]